MWKESGEKWNDYALERQYNREIGRSINQIRQLNEGLSSHFFLSWADPTLIHSSPIGNVRLYCTDQRPTRTIKS